MLPLWQGGRPRCRPGDGKHNLALFASSASDQKSYATIDQKYSRFTEFLARSLTGRIPDAIESREVTTHTFAKSIRAHEWHEDQQPKCYEGRKAIVLARPNVPVAVPFRMPQDKRRSIFRRYIEGHLSELQDEVEVTSNEYFTVARCQRYLLKGLPYGRQKDVPTEGVLTDRLQAWAETEQPLLLVLGDTGLGKTTNLQRFWYDQARAWIEQKTLRVPFLVDMRLFSGVRLHEGEGNELRRHQVDEPPLEDHIARRFRAVFTDLLQNREELPIVWEDFVGLVKSGSILLILDGLDEMDSDGLRGAIETHLALIAQLWSPRVKIILSCRTHYLRSDNDLSRVLGGLAGESEPIPLLELRPFDADQVTRYLTTRLGSVRRELWHRLKQEDRMGLLRLCERPFLLQYVVSHFDTVVDGNCIRPSMLFFGYLAAWLRAYPNNPVQRYVMIAQAR